MRFFLLVATLAFAPKCTFSLTDIIDLPSIVCPDKRSEKTCCWRTKIHRLFDAKIESPYECRPFNTRREQCKNPETVWCCAVVISPPDDPSGPGLGIDCERAKHYQPKPTDARKYCPAGPRSRLQKGKRSVDCVSDNSIDPDPEPFQLAEFHLDLNEALGDVG